MHLLSVVNSVPLLSICKFRKLLNLLADKLTNRQGNEKIVKTEKLMSIIQKYVWTINTIRQAGRISFKELNTKWMNTDMSNGLPLSRQTFIRWKNGILDMFGIIIEYVRKGDYYYYIENPEVLEEGELEGWMLNTCTTLDTLSECLSLKDRILVEEIPPNQHFLTDIIRAMKEHRTIQMTYKRFGGNAARTSEVAPYCVKLFQRRWYLLAKTSNGALRTYALDRMEQVSIAGRTFVFPKDFDARSYFSPFFGIVTQDDVELEVERIVIRAKGTHADYLRTLPLHHSQKEIGAGDGYADFELHVVPTYDFVMELLRAGNKIEVLESEYLRREMHDWAKELWEIYK